MLSRFLVTSCMADSHQVRRIIELLTVLGSGHHLTTSELATRVEHRVEGKTVSRRQIQRDLRAIEAAGIPLHTENDGKELRWWIPASYRSLVPVAFGENELLAIHLLKGMLRQFRGTTIEADIDRLARQLEKVAPGSILFDANIINEVTPGVVTTPIPDNVLRSVINGIRDVAWDRVTYRALHDNQTRTFVVALCRLVLHAGRLYVAAWHPKHHYITMAVDRILNVERALDITLPFHVFNEQQYRRERFGVYSGKVCEITLHVRKESADFFKERLWHPSQRFKSNRDGSVNLYLTAPINPELIAWIISWAEALTPKKPKRLVNACLLKAQAISSW